MSDKESQQQQKDQRQPCSGYMYPFSNNKKQDSTFRKCKYDCQFEVEKTLLPTDGNHKTSKEAANIWRKKIKIITFDF